MITVSIRINERPLYTRSAVNTGERDADGRTRYRSDDGKDVFHNVEDGAVALAQKLLKLIEEYRHEPPPPLLIGQRVVVGREIGIVVAPEPEVRVSFNGMSPLAVELERIKRLPHGQV